LHETIYREKRLGRREINSSGNLRHDEWTTPGIKLESDAFLDVPAF
jgi:hypothetical protein